jgi:Magnesium chelatase, subunit ChlI
MGYATISVYRFEFMASTVRALNGTFLLTRQRSILLDWPIQGKSSRGWLGGSPPFQTMTLPDALDTPRIHRVAGLIGNRTALVTTRPFRVPHHPISDVGLIGGGPVPLPGEGSRAHHGMLFLDERPEFRRHVLEVLRQPLEESVIYIQSPERHDSQ